MSSVVTAGPPSTPATALDAIMRPRAIAVVGASRSADTIGHQIVQNLLRFGFTGAVYPVNPNASSVHSIRAYPSVGAIPEVVDLALVVVPKQHVLSVADECGRAGVRGLVVISAGFAETGSEGRAAERDLVATVRRYGMRMVGPNCMGVLNGDPEISMNATFAPNMPPPGRAAFVSQSGALGVSVLDYAKEYGIGIAQFVSVGNKPDVSGNDLLLQWEHDPAVGVILMYVENVGNPRRFLEIASRVTKRKPILMVKSGRSRVGARAASSHTGALAASDAVVDALLAQAGVLRAASIEELFDMAMAFGEQRLPRSPRTAVVTNSGGPGILAADALETHGLDVVELAPETIRKLVPLFPAEASIRNPLDMIASASAHSYHVALDAVLSDAGVDTAVAIFVPPLGVRQEDIAESIVGVARAYPDKPVLAVLMGREGLPQGRAELHRAGIPAYIFPESAARALSAMYRQQEWCSRPEAHVPALQVDRAAVARVVAGARQRGRTKLAEGDALAVLDAYGIPTTPTRAARDGREAARVAAAIGFPVAIKVISPQILHKTDVGGVRLGLTSGDEVEAAAAEIAANVRRARPDADVEGVLVQHMARGGRETIAGLTRDPAFGPLVMFGLGGIFVEALRDVVFRIAPLTDLDARDMPRALRAAAVLEGVRGEARANLAAVEQVLLRISQLAMDFPEIAELDINPLLADASGVVALDARVVLTPTSEG